MCEQVSDIIIARIVSQETAESIFGRQARAVVSGPSAGEEGKARHILLSKDIRRKAIHRSRKSRPKCIFF